MKRILLTLFCLWILSLLCMWASLVNAQPAPQQLCFINVNGGCTPVSSNDPYPVNATATVAFPTIGVAVPLTGIYNGINVAGTLRGTTGLALGSTFSQTIAIVDASGNQITSFGGSNAAVGVTGAAVPASANYVGINIAGNLIGWNGAVTQSGNWTSRVVGNIGGVLDAIGQNVTAPANWLQVGCQFNTSPTTISSGSGSPCQMDNAGNLLVKINAGLNSNGQAANSASAPVVISNQQMVAAGSGSTTQVMTVQGAAGMNKLLVTPDSVALPANQSVNAAQFGGTNVSTGTGAGGAGIPRVTVSNDSTVGLVAGTAAIGTIAGNVNVTPTDCSLALTTGGTAQNIIAATATIHGFTIANIDTSAGSGEPVWISLTTTAAASTIASYPLAAPTATTFAGLSSYTTPLGFGINHAVSVVAATTGHKISCTYW
jgi:hypothetical protein